MTAWAWALVIVAGIALPFGFWWIIRDYIGLDRKPPAKDETKEPEC